MTATEFRLYWKKREAASQSKYRAIPTTSSDGQNFRSHLEATYYNRLKLLQAAGVLTRFEREVRFEMIVNGFLVCAYVCDFILYYSDGTVEHVDCKSQPTKTPVYVIKKKLMKACHGIEIKEVFE